MHRARALERRAAPHQVLQRCALHALNAESCFLKPTLCARWQDVLRREHFLADHQHAAWLEHAPHLAQCARRAWQHGQHRDHHHGVERRIAKRQPGGSRLAREHTRRKRAWRSPLERAQHGLLHVQRKNHTSLCSEWQGHHAIATAEVEHAPAQLRRQQANQRTGRPIDEPRAAGEQRR